MAALTRDQLMDLSNEELRGEAESRGIDPPKGARKEQLVELLEAQEVAEAAAPPPLVTPPPAPDPVPVEQPSKAVTFDDDQYAASHLAEDAERLLGEDAYLVRVALRRDGGDFYTLAEAHACVAALKAHEVEVT